MRWNVIMSEIRRVRRFLGSTRYWFSIRFVSWTCRIRQRRCIHVLHVRKTGGTAIKAALADVLNTPTYRILFHPHRIRLCDIPRRDETIVFLREPVSRFVSGFYSRMRKGQPRNYVPWRPEEEIAFAKFATPNELALALSSENPAIREAAVRAMKSITHLRYQYRYWLLTPQEILSRKERLFVGRQETLNSDFEMLKVWLGIPLTKAQLPTDPVKAHRMPEVFDMHLDPQAVENLRNWYAEDYGLLEVADQIREELFAKLAKAAER